MRYSMQNLKVCEEYISPTPRKLQLLYYNSNSLYSNVFFVDSPYASALQSFLSVTSGQLQTPEYSSNQRPEEQVYSSASPSTHE